MPEILMATDAPWVYEEVRSVVVGPDTTIRWVRTGAMVLPAVHRQLPDLLITDFQIGNMGGMAVCLDVRLEEGAGRMEHIPVLMLLDRRADVFLARRSGAEGWLVKPMNPIKVRRAVTALLAGQEYRDESYAPDPLFTALPEVAEAS